MLNTNTEGLNEDLNFPAVKQQCYPPDAHFQYKYLTCFKKSVKVSVNRDVNPWNLHSAHRCSEQRLFHLLCPTAPPRGGLTSELEHLGSSYLHIQQQQQQMGLTTLEQQDYDTDPFRQGLTPPQMPGDHMHPYGKGPTAVRHYEELCLYRAAWENFS